MTKALLLLALAAPPAGAVTLRSEKLYSESLAAYEQGRYQQALEGFMDVILEDPQYPQAREKLAEAARKLLDREAVAIEQERKKIIATLNLKTARRQGFQRDESRAERWRKSAARAAALAAKPRKFREALEAYEESLSLFPARHDGRAEFLKAKVAFQSGLLQGRPDIARDPAWRDRRPGSFSTGELAATLAVESEQARRFDAARGEIIDLASSQPPDVITQTAASIRERELRREDELRWALQAHYQLKRGRAAESAALWKKILAANPENEEAQFYLKEAERELAEPSRTAAAAAPAKQASPPAPAPEQAPPSRAPAAAQELAQEHYLKGLRSYSLGELGSAAQQWKAALEMDPAHPKAQKALDRLSLESKP